MMSEAAMEARRAYQKKYRAEHKDKIKEYNYKYRNSEKGKAAAKRGTEAYWERKAAMM